ncbi:hypothetical protein KSS87_017495 [Heliosperma pusillum]|nr:hypothetical protein KSS87_017495 [Heliosperma pusillum]
MLVMATGTIDGAAAMEEKGSSTECVVVAMAVEGNDELGCLSMGVWRV